MTRRKYLFTATARMLVGFYPSPPNAADAPVAQGIEQRPPEPCAQVRILPGALRRKCPRDPAVSVNAEDGVFLRGQRCVRTGRDIGGRRE